MTELLRQEIRELLAKTPSRPWWFDGRDIFHKDGIMVQLVIPLPETWHESQRVPDVTAQLVCACVNYMDKILS